MGELAPLLPGVSRTALQRRFTRPVIELGENEAVFWRPEVSNGSARLAAVETVALQGDAAAVLAAGRAAVTRLAQHASAGIAAPKVVLVLNPRQILRKELVLPAAVEENLVQTLGYDLDRHTPFRPEQVYFDAVVVGRDAAKKTVRVDWVAALKTVVDAVTRQVEQWGAVPVAVMPGPPAVAPSRLNLLPHAARPRPLQWRRWQVWAPVALVAGFAVAAAFVPLLQKRQYAIALIALDAQAGQQAQAADKLRAQLEAMQNDYNFVLAKKYGYPSTVHVLDEVTRVLPDDTWITQLELKTTGRAKELTHDVYLRGESGNAGKLIALLEDSKLMEQVTPRSPTTKIQGGTGEIFDLGAHVRKVSLPAPQQLALLPAPLAPAPTMAAPPVPAGVSPPGQTPAPMPAGPAPGGVSGPVVGGAPVSPTAAAGFGPFPSGPIAGPTPGGRQRPSREVARPAAPAPVPQAAPQPAMPAAPAVPAPQPPQGAMPAAPAGDDTPPPPAGEVKDDD
jgi:general secretion pathway protein L